MTNPPHGYPSWCSSEDVTRALGSMLPPGATIEPDRRPLHEGTPPLTAGDVARLYDVPLWVVDPACSRPVPTWRERLDRAVTRVFRLQPVYFLRDHVRVIVCWTDWALPLRVDIDRTGGIVGVLCLSVTWSRERWDDSWNNL